MKKSSWVWAAGLLALGTGTALWWNQRQAASAPSYRTAAVERGALQASVSASGTVNPVSQVSVGTQVSGQVRAVHVDFNTEVRAGQLIAEIDPESIEHRVRSAQADLDAANAAVLSAQANAAAGRAQVSRAQSELAEAERIHERNQQLVARGFVAQSEADRSAAAANSAREGLKATQAQLAVAQAQIQSAQASVAQRTSALAQARVDLSRTRILSPVNGIVIKRSVEVGQTVAASLQAPELFVIAQNLSDMQVEASIDEADVGRIRSGQAASFSVDAFPGQRFEGQLRQVRKAAQNVSNVVTYTAIVRFANRDGRLLPGMTANVRIVTEAREDALKLPNAALRVRLPGIEPAAASAATDTPATAVPGGARNPMAAMRERLLQAVSPTAEQTVQIDALLEAARPRFMTLRELPEAERPKARERIMAELRSAIGERLAPEQQAAFAAWSVEQAGRQTTQGQVFVLDAQQRPVAHKVRLGISDGSHTELLLAPGSAAAEALREGVQVVTGVLGAGGASGSGGAGRSPRLPF